MEVRVVYHLLYTGLGIPSLVPYIGGFYVLG